MKKTLLALSFALLSTVTFAQELVKVEALGGKISILAPKGFGQMPADLLEIKYPSSKKPSEVLSDKTGGISLAFNHTKRPLQPSQIKDAHISVSRMFHNLYPSATWIRDEIIEQGGTTFLVMELITPAVDTQIHNIMYGTSVDGRFLLAAFNTTVEQSEQWLPIGKKIMSSLRVQK